MRLVVLAVFLVAAAACERDPAEPSVAAVIDPARPCEVATATEVAEAVGAPAAEPRTVEARAREGASKDGTMLCAYSVGRPFGTVTMQVETDVSEAKFADRMARDPRNTEELEGTGELAFVHGGVNVSAWEDGKAISASLRRLESASEAREALEGLAGLIATKL